MVETAQQMAKGERKKEWESSVACSAELLTFCLGIAVFVMVFSCVALIVSRLVAAGIAVLIAICIVNVAQQSEARK